MIALTLLLKGHRFILIASTVALGVTGSKVAEDFADVSWWLFLAAAAVALGLADILRPLADNTRELAAKTKSRYADTSRDVLSVSRRVTVISLVGSCLALVSAGVFFG